jgi:hypothetical protein
MKVARWGRSGPTFTREDRFCAHDRHATRGRPIRCHHFWGGGSAMLMLCIIMEYWPS